MDMFKVLADAGQSLGYGEVLALLLWEGLTTGEVSLKSRVLKLDGEQWYELVTLLFEQPGRWPLPLPPDFEARQ